MSWFFVEAVTNDFGDDYYIIFEQGQFHKPVAVIDASNMAHIITKVSLRVAKNSERGKGEDALSVLLSCRGVLDWQEGDEPAEETIRRMRGSDET